MGQGSALPHGERKVRNNKIKPALNSQLLTLNTKINLSGGNIRRRAGNFYPVAHAINGLSETGKCELPVKFVLTVGESFNAHKPLHRVGKFHKKSEFPYGGNYSLKTFANMV